MSRFFISILFSVYSMWGIKKNKKKERPPQDKIKVPTLKNKDYKIFVFYSILEASIQFRNSWKYLFNRDFYYRC